MTETAENTDKKQQEKFVRVRHHEIMKHKRNGGYNAECGKMHDDCHAVHFVFEIRQKRIRNTCENSTQKCHEQREHIGVEGGVADKGSTCESYKKGRNLNFSDFLLEKYRRP